MLLAFQAIPDIPDEQVSGHIALISVALTICGNVLILILRRRERRREEEQMQEDARERDAVRKSIRASGLERMGSDGISKAVFRWLQRHEGQTVKVQRGKPGDCLHEEYIEWTIPPFEMDMNDTKDEYGRRVRYSFSSVRYAFTDEYGSVNWEFPPETWHEADLSDDQLVYSLGWRIEHSAEMGESEVSVSKRSQVTNWSHWTLTAQTPKVA